MKIKKFEFGDNWQKFSKHIDCSKYQSAQESIFRLVGDLSGKTFLDIGCGSGLFSLAALGLGASKVVAFDNDPICIKVAKDNFDNLAIDDSRLNKTKINFFKKSLFDRPLDSEKFDVVYSWGVLHHTGNMYQAFDIISKYVSKDGILVISIYNRHFSSFFWKKIKWFYNQNPQIIKNLMVGLFFPIIFLAKLLFTAKNPFKRERGMIFYYDLIDWLGGYPYEYASIDEVIDCFSRLGFSLLLVKKASVPTGCNEYVFKLKEDKK